MKILCGHPYILKITKNIHYITWSNGKYARKTIRMNCPDLSDADITAIFEEANKQGCYSIPARNITVLSSHRQRNDEVYAAFNQALTVQTEFVRAPVCLFDMRDYRYYIPRDQKNSAWFPDEYGPDGSNNSEYIWMIKTRGYTQATNYVWISSTQFNNSLCRKMETSFDTAPFVFFGASEENTNSVLSERELHMPLLSPAENQLYSDFVSYYSVTFRSDISRFLASYSALGLPMQFSGFCKGNLVNVDTFYLGKNINNLYFPSQDSIAKFSLALWTIVISDIVVYDRYHQLSEEWEKVTKYPKFTSWNYSAASPSLLLNIISKVYPENDTGTELDHLIASIGTRVVYDIANDITTILKLNRTDQHEISAFASSWLTRSGEGIPYDPKCYLY